MEYPRKGSEIIFNKLRCYIIKFATFVKTLGIYTQGHQKYIK
jgi:hypothetical protein